MSAMTPDGPVGFTCQSFSSHSLSPTLISFSVNTSSASWPLVRSAGCLGVSVLAEDQEDVARTFATSGIDKFAGVSWTLGPGGSPLLEGALAHFEGEIIDVSTHGDHDIVIVGATHATAHPGRPLLYYRGTFSKFT